MANHIENYIIVENSNEEVLKEVQRVFQLEEDKCFGANQASVTSAYAGGNAAVRGTALTGGLGTQGCAAADHSKATVSSFHLGGALTWTF